MENLRIELLLSKENRFIILLQYRDKSDVDYTNNTVIDCNTRITT